MSEHIILDFVYCYVRVWLSVVFAGFVQVK